MLVLASLGLLALLGVDQLFTAIPEWAQQASLVTIGMTVASAALLALPVRSFPGAGMWASHPVMWTGAMAISWWLVITVAGVTLVPTVAVTVAAIVLVLISRPSGARIDTPPPAVPVDTVPVAPPAMAAAEAPTATPAAAPINAGMPASDPAVMPQPPAQQSGPPGQQPAPPAPVPPTAPPQPAAAPPATPHPANPPGVPHGLQTPEMSPPDNPPVLPTAESPARFYPPTPPQAGSVPVPPGAAVLPGEPAGGDSDEPQNPVAEGEGPAKPASESDGR